MDVYGIFTSKGSKKPIVPFQQKGLHDRFFIF